MGYRKSVVCVNTLEASGSCLSAIEEGKYPAPGDRLVYRKGKALNIVVQKDRLLGLSAL